MAANEETRNDVVEHSGLSVLLKSLQCATPITTRKINESCENTGNAPDEQNAIYSIDLFTLNIFIPCGNNLS